MTTFNPRDFWDPWGWFESPERDRRKEGIDRPELGSG